MVGAIDWLTAIWYHFIASRDGDGCRHWKRLSYSLKFNSSKQQIPPIAPVCPVDKTECSLDCLGRGQKALVSAVGGPNRCRLLELGFTNGTEVQIERRAAFGGPLEIRLRSYRLSLRKDEAATILVTLPPVENLA